MIDGNITCVQNADGTFNVTIPNVWLNIVPYVAPPAPPAPIPPPPAPAPAPEPAPAPAPVPAPPVPPAPVTIVSQTLTADKPTVMVGDHVTFTGVLNMSDGTTKPVTATSYTWDHTRLSTGNSYTSRFLAIAVGDAKVSNDNSRTTGRCTVTVIANDGTVFPPDPPPVVKPPAPPAPPKPPAPAPAPTPAPPKPPAPAPAPPLVYSNLLRAEVLALSMAVGCSDNSTPAAGLTMSKISWDFGDGSTDTGASLQHLYAKAGTYIVKETVTFSDGTVAAQSFYAVIGLTPQFVVDGRSVLYHLDGNELTEAINWNFGDGTNAGDGIASGRHPYAAAGTYAITGSVTYRAPNDSRVDSFGPFTVVVP